eukprot:PITA_35812
MRVPNFSVQWTWLLQMRRMSFWWCYLDDLTVFSKSDEEHMYHLKTVFQKCRKYGLSLNPKKSLFAMEEGKLLGHIISKDDIRIDPESVQAIHQIDVPRNKKEIQSFNGKMNFLRRFVPNLVEHLREMTHMLKKDSQVKWMEEDIKSFNLVKLALSSAPVLVSPDYTQDFLLFSFASEHTMAVVLLQKRDDHERSIAFFSRAIRDAALKYNIIEKQALALVKALKDFRVYILHSHILAYVPNAAVKYVLVKTDLEGRRGKWIAALLEYDVEIKPPKLVKGQGLAKLMAESNLHPLDINLIVALSNEDEEGSSIQVFEMFSLSPWYSYIIYVLKNFSPPPGMTRNKARTLKLKAAKFCILNSTLYWKDPGGVLLNCLVEKEAKKFMEDYHQGDCGGHLFWKSTANKILRAGMVEFCHKYHIILGHSTAYHLQGNGLVESSNKSLVNIIKKLLEINKKSWHKRFVNVLWADRVSQKKSIGTSPFELVYGVDIVFPTSLAAPVVKLLQEAGSEEDPMQRRKAKVDKFQVDDVVLKWDARNEEKGKHGKFENLWKGPFKIAAYWGQNAFLLKEMNVEDCPRGPINGRLLKRYHF